MIDVSNYEPLLLLDGDSLHKVRLLSAPSLISS